jgi:hypothetical protein
MAANVKQNDDPTKNDLTPAKTAELNQTISRLSLLRPALAERAQDAVNMRALAGVGGYAHVHVMMRDLDARARLLNSQSGEPGLTILRAQPIPTTFVDFRGDRWEWTRMRMRRFRPDLIAAIDGCPGKSKLAEACGYEDNGKLFEGLMEWETKNGFAKEVQQQGMAFKSQKMAEREKQMKKKNKTKNKK